MSCGQLPCEEVVLEFTVVKCTRAGDTLGDLIFNYADAKALAYVRSRAQQEGLLQVLRWDDLACP